jgi:hypothetical protein
MPILIKRIRGTIHPGWLKVTQIIFLLSGLCDKIVILNSRSIEFNCRSLIEGVLPKR